MKLGYLATLVLFGFLLLVAGCRGHKCSYLFLSDLRAIVQEHNAMVKATDAIEKNDKHALKDKACQRFWQRQGKDFNKCSAVQKYTELSINAQFVEQACNADISTTELLPESTHLDT